MAKGFLILFCLVFVWCHQAYREDELNVGEKLTLDQYLESPNGNYRFYLQGDGDLVLRDWQSRKALWSSGTHKQVGRELVMQGDGNLVLYTSSGKALWAADTDRTAANRLVLQDDGNLVLYGSDGNAHWNTGTGSGSGSGSVGAISYKLGGGINTTRGNITVSSKAQRGDYEIVSIGGSSVGGGDQEPIDSRLMTEQDFRLVGVCGTYDVKSEIWIRKNGGQDSIRVTGDGLDVAWQVTTIDGQSISLDIQTLPTEKYERNHGRSRARFKTPNGPGFTFAAVCFDDSVKLTKADNGKILFTKWGFGDGDGFATVIFQPGANLPSHLSVHDHDGGNLWQLLRLLLVKGWQDAWEEFTINGVFSSGGEQYVVVAFNSGRIASENDPSRSERSSSPSSPFDSNSSNSNTDNSLQEDDQRYLDETP